ncbi:ccp1 [Symbiodinium natans]|uniref:Ccp1 protein n=1 Tax=Symbiodinium natans TaxID=878477 RepID=A0A812IF96_9DINO|nr:ccp1 [Symbiodinium natans]
MEIGSRGPWVVIHGRRGYRVRVAGTPVFEGPSPSAEAGRLQAGDEVSFDEVQIQSNESQGPSLPGLQDLDGWKPESMGSLPHHDLVLTAWLEMECISFPRTVLFCELSARTGHQMMLVSDMVLLWDAGFREHLEAYAEDEDLLKREFGEAFKKLTELGCPWSKAHRAHAHLFPPSSGPLGAADLLLISSLQT